VTATEPLAGHTAALSCLTLTEPWASLMACGAKRMETRTWMPSTRVGGRLGSAPRMMGIHAGVRMSGWDRDFALEPRTLAVLRRHFPEGWIHDRLGLESEQGVEPEPCPDPARYTATRCFPSSRGNLIAVGVLRACNPTFRQRFGGGLEQHPRAPDPASDEWYFGDYSRGRFFWEFAHVVPIPEPAPVKGVQLVWEWPGKEQPAWLVAFLADYAQTWRSLYGGPRPIAEADQAFLELRERHAR
jgi:activating signal cointegrator 1